MMGSLCYDLDPTEVFLTAEAGKIDLAHVESFLAPLAGTQVRRFFFCPAAATAITRLEHWELFASGFDAGKGPEQEALRGHPGLFRLAANVHRMLNAGVDIVDYVLQCSRKHRMEAWLTMRMNDMHDAEDETSPLHSSWWRQHPELRISPVPYENGLDFSRPEVLQLVWERGAELIDKYPIDGFQTDWLRFPMFFRHGEGRANAERITGLMRRFREKITAKERRTNRKIGFSARVPGLPDTAAALGLDVAAWCREKWIDNLVVAPFLTMDGGLPVAEWRRIAGPEISLFYGLEIMTSASLAAPRSFAGEEEWRGAAAYALRHGADGIYLFNFFKPVISLYPRMFDELGTLETLRGKPQLLRQSWHDVALPLSEFDRALRLPAVRRQWRQAHGKHADAVSRLPARIAPGRVGEFELWCGDAPESDRFCMLDLECSGGGGEVPQVKVNGVPAECCGCLGRHWRYNVASGTILTGCNRIEAAAAKALRIEDVQLRIC